MPHDKLYLLWLLRLSCARLRGLVQPMSHYATLKRLEQRAGRRLARLGDGREWTNAGAVHQEPEHVLEVLRVLHAAGLEDVLDAELLELLREHEEL